jgi:DNA polymerase-3 subunit delta
VKANKAQIERALRNPAAHRFFLLYGPDDSGSRSLAKLVAGAVGSEAERIELTGAELKSDPARLSDEAASISLFGGARYIFVDPAGDESTTAAEGLLQLPVAGNPVVLIAGALKPSSKLLKLALASDSAMAFASYAPEGLAAEKLALEMARERGLTARPDLARRLADSCGGNRAILAQELDKLALYLDAGPEHPQPLEHEALDAVGASTGEGDLSRLVAGVGLGNAQLLHSELLRLSSEGIEGIVLIRAVLRRMILLARLRAEVERGNSVDAVMASQGKALFWKDKDSVAPQLQRWRSSYLTKSIDRLVEAERQAKASGGLGSVAVDEELFAICRQAARLR